MLGRMQILGVLTVGYVLEPILSRVYMQRCLEAGEKASRGSSGGLKGFDSLNPKTQNQNCKPNPEPSSRRGKWRAGGGSAGRGREGEGSEE
jgi:hypothetical protein